MRDKNKILQAKPRLKQKYCPLYIVQSKNAQKPCELDLWHMTLKLSRL